MTVQAASAWWRSAVVYQIYPRSFMDGNGDGIGDLTGAIARLPYLKQLGIDALWFTPWYMSPFADGGYDVADYRQIDPRFGNLRDAENLIRQAGDLGMRVIVDIVPNHVSDRHPWFQAALNSPAGSPERARFWFRDGKGARGDQMPTNWLSSFRGHTWSRTANPDGTPGQWYLHLFTSGQPDLNWNNSDVRAEHEAILRFWFDRGAAGVRVDSAVLIVKDPALPDLEEGQPSRPGEHPFVDRDELHDIYRSWRAVAESYDPPRMLVGEVWLDDADRFAAYLRSDEMNMSFNFDFMSQPWEAIALRDSIETALAAHARVNAPATWVLSNHDVTRPVTRYGRSDTSFAFDRKRFGIPTDMVLGTKRARAAFLLCAALPGSLYVYQGEELGLPEDEDLPVEVIEDPMFFRSNGIDPGRDGCRVPIPWAERAGNNFGFSASDSTAKPTRGAWLPQPDWWGRYSVEAEEKDPASMLTFYRRALAIRHDRSELQTEGFAWLPDCPPTCLEFRRGDIACIVNFGPEAVSLPTSDVLISSGPVDCGAIGPDTAAWIDWPEAAPSTTTSTLK